MDLMEVPSHVVERFASAPSTLGAFARHHMSGQPIPAELAERLHRSQRMFEAITIQQQVPSQSCWPCHTALQILALCKVATGRACGKPADRIPSWRVLSISVCTPVQVVDSLIDQRLHGPRASTSGSTSEIVQEVMQEHSVFPFVPGTCPQAR